MVIRYVHAAACSGRIADRQAPETMAPHIDHLVQVSDDAVAQAMRELFQDTHNVAEGADAAGFAAAQQERALLRGQWVGVALSGGNVDSSVLVGILAAG